MSKDLETLSNTTSLGNSMLAEIGRVTVNFSLLELKFSKMSFYLLGVSEQRALAITSESSFSSLQSLCMVLLKQRQEAGELAVSFELDLKEAYKLVDRAVKERNSITHSLWGALGADKVIRTKYTAKSKKGLFLQRDEMQATDLRDIAILIAEAAATIDTLAKAIYKELLKSNALHPSAPTSSLRIM